MSTTTTSSLIIATHNIMRGRFLDQLLPAYHHLAQQTGLDVLCLQENDYHGDTEHAEQIAAALGAQYRVVRDASEVSVATVYNREVLRHCGCTLLPLPRLTSLRWFEHFYLRDGLDERKFALVSAFETITGAPLQVVNFHLEAGGGNDHKYNQMCTISRFLHRQKATGASLVACGDTNAFTLWPSQQAGALQKVLAPLMAHCKLHSEDHPTHFFARQREEYFVSKLFVWFGKLGIDIPYRLDVMCANMPVRSRGQITTPGSDHDLLWTEVEPAF